MSRTARLRSNLRLVNLDDDRTALACGEEPLLVFPAAYSAGLDRLFGSLDGTLAVEEILTGLEPVESHRVRELLAFLVEEGAVVLDGGTPGTSVERFLDTTIGRWRPDIDDKPTVCLIGKGALSDAVEELLVASGYRTRHANADIGDASLIFCDCNAVGLAEARQLNGAANEVGTSALYAYRPTLFESVVGPLVVPGVTPCFECFLGRWVANSSPVSARDASAQTDGFALSSPPAITYATASLATLEMMKHMEHLSVPSTWNGVLIANHRLGETNRHHVLRLPNCVVCRDIPAKPVTAPRAGNPGCGKDPSLAVM